jgi:hypothetical protein
MNKIIKSFVLVFAVALFFISNSCDKFDTFPLNVPFSIDVSTSGNSNPTDATPVTYCLTQSQTYQDYVNDIVKLTFVEAAWRTTSVSNITKGDVTVTLKIKNGTILFQKVLSDVNPSDYIKPKSPYILNLAPTEIDLLNKYLETYRVNPQSAPCLEASLQAFVTSGNPPYSLVGIVDMVVEAETKLK